jgi:glycerol uptake facilitator protein
MAPFLIGLAVAAIGLSIGTNAGYAINPARDLGPRVFTWLAGWGDLAFPGAGAWFDKAFTGTGGACLPRTATPAR